MLQAQLSATPSTRTLSPDTESDNCSQYMTDRESTPVSTTPSHTVTPSPMAVWKLQGLGPMSNRYI